MASCAQLLRVLRSRMRHLASRKPELSSLGLMSGPCPVLPAATNRWRCNQMTVQ